MRTCPALKTQGCYAVNLLAGIRTCDPSITLPLSHNATRQSKLYITSEGKRQSLQFLSHLLLHFLLHTIHTFFFTSYGINIIIRGLNKRNMIVTAFQFGYIGHIFKNILYHVLCIVLLQFHCFSLQLTKMHVNLNFNRVTFCLPFTLFTDKYAYSV